MLYTSIKSVIYEYVLLFVLKFYNDWPISVKSTDCKYRRDRNIRTPSRSAAGQRFPMYELLVLGST